MTETKQNNINLNQPLFYVGIGASAGGLEALEVFFNNMPDNNGMTFIVVQHLSPDYKSMMVELLARKTKMEVIQIEDGMLPKPNCIYLIPPQKNLTIYHSQLILTEQVRDTTLNLPIDIFFRSLAIDAEKKSVGIILSGTGSDGTLGIKAIKEQGGLVMVQNINDAKFDGMPKSAINTGLVDYILNVNEMGRALVDYVNHPNIIQETTEQSEAQKEETDYIKILSLIRANVGIDFSFYKPKTIIRRIERRISINQLQNLDEYVKLLANSKAESETLAREFLIGVTQFFRDGEAYSVLEEELIPAVFKNTTPQEPIRIWSVGCSTGEEAYSIAMLCAEFIEQQELNVDFKVFATDLDKEAIKYAGIGIYPESIVADVPEKFLTKYFIKRQESYQINERIRQLVIFANHDVTVDPPFSKIDLVVCRNLLIYFKQELQQKVLGLFQYSLSKGGYMFLGSSESISGVSEAFKVINSKWKIFKFKPGFGTFGVKDLYNKPALKQNLTSKLNTYVDRTVPEKHNPLSELYEKTMNYFAPPGVVVDENNVIIHFFDGIKRFISFSSGKADNNILEYIDPQLTMVLSNMLYKVRKEKNEITLNKFKYKDNGQNILLNLSAKVINLKNKISEFVIITIEEAERYEQQENENDVNYDYNQEASERIKELERDLQYRDENLQTTIEELETSNEELQATNEELVSSNEELQSTNEELQSVNEELYTVNSQYQEKINELTELNNDINNLLANTNIGTVFLDSRLVIRKFTPEIANTLNILEVDIDRPFHHITSNCDYKNFQGDVSEVLEDLQPKEIEAQGNNGEWYFVKIQPYRHSDRSIHGILITQINISALKRSKQEFASLFKTLPLGVVYQNNEGQIIMANATAEEILGLTQDQMMGVDSIDPRWQSIREDGSEFPGNEHPAMQALKTGKIIKDITMGVKNPKKKDTTWIKISAVPLFQNNEKKPFQVYATFKDITEEKRTRDLLHNTLTNLKLSKKKYEKLFNSLTMGFAYHKIITDKNNKAIDYEFIKVNNAFEKITGLKAKRIIGKKITSIFPDIEKNWIETYGKVALNNEIVNFKQYSGSLDKVFKVKAYSPEKGFFVALFEEEKDA